MIKGELMNKETITLLIDEYSKELKFNQEVLKLLKADKKLKEVRMLVANRQLDLKKKIKHIKEEYDYE